MIKKFYLNNKKVFLLLSIYIILYYIFYFIFFVFFKSISVEGFIGFNILLMFFFIYKFFGTNINTFFLNISKNIWLYFINFLNLVIGLKNLILDLSFEYLNLLYIQICILSLLYSEISNILNNNYYLFLKNYFLNYISLKFFYKLNFLKLVNSNINLKNVEILFNKVNNFYLFNFINMKLFLKNV